MAELKALSCSYSELLKFHGNAARFLLLKFRARGDDNPVSDAIFFVEVELRQEGRLPGARVAIESYVPSAEQNPRQPVLRLHGHLHSLFFRCVLVSWLGTNAGYKNKLRSTCLQKSTRRTGRGGGGGGGPQRGEAGHPRLP